MIASFILEEKLVILILDKPTSMSITASVLKVKETGVSLVGLLGVVWYAHNTLGSSLAHFPLAPSNLFFNPLTMALFVASA